MTAVRSGESVTAYENSGDELHRRDSISSRGSWMRRLSILPSSNNSPRSSVGPDSPSIQLSVGSAAPILSTPTTSPTQLPPNKLVKRAPSTRSSSDGPLTRTRSRTHLPTLRRPATSHQRSFTLQQQSRENSRDPSFETPTRQPPSQTQSHSQPQPQSQSTPFRRFHSSEPRSSWRQYFESRVTRIARERSSGFSTESNIQNFQTTSKRVVQDENAKPTLLKPQMITATDHTRDSYDDEGYDFEHARVENEQDASETIGSPSEPIERQKRARRSLSMHFSSPSSWITRSGSLRKRNDATQGGGKRYSSAPGLTLPARSTTSAHGSRPRAIMDPIVYQRQTHTSAEHNSPTDPFALSFNARSRNISSPLPPLSRLSSFNIDLARSGLASSSSSVPRHSPTSSLPQTSTTAATSLTSTSHITSPPLSNYFTSSHSKSPRTSELADRTSTLVGSDNDTKGFASGDEDDMDFQSDTVYDSLRSGATNSIRSHNIQLDAMFEESPPSVTGPARKKRLSIHEMLVNGGFQEDNSQILEEDEGMPTPVKGSRSSAVDFDTPTRLRPIVTDHFPSSPPTFSLGAKDFGRLSLDDEDDDEDWTRDEENLDVGNLSPPSSMNSRKLSPSFRAALADVTHSGSSNGNFTPGDRPKSNLFDWAEPSSAEKVDYMGNSPRPKTAHVKQADGRGGRAIGRRGPGALHVRSQSVPVVPDVTGQRDVSKLTPKFGTWGLGAKGVSEDWDNDFEFDGLEEEETDVKMENSGMLVPPAIQASQASVVGHVGQIREVCLLVEDLKRLRLLAKEKNLLDGKSAALWKEAEGIIALAVPDEEDEDMSPSQRSSTSIVIEDDFDDRFHDDGFDAEDIEIPESPLEILNGEGKPTGLMYDGNTVRRRSVFSPDDDIFGAGELNSPPSREYLRPPSTSTRNSSMQSASEVARSVMETMHQHRSTSDPMLGSLTSQASNKMPFDTTSLRDLVHRANVLTRTLSDLIRKAEGRSDSPEEAPERESSPAFTRVFTDPMQSPPKHLLRSQSNNSGVTASIDTSPTRSLGQRMQMMTVV